ncbi:glycosyltransferase family 4 protein [archaeon]|jgi:glycosyltransferase involved in cell wall biosynthesis|nr:glycosyltransferase family 4 protein [archaeon]MBT6821846.1 glycosyltransferase family 4 protein [archaeon]MBT7392256.1 glycosyltransferase family 4 protein [archaeon]
MKEKDKKKRKKLLIVSDAFLPRWDGIARFLYEIIPRLSKTYDITILTTDNGKIQEDLGVKIVQISKLNLRLGDFYPSKIDFVTATKLVSKSDVVFVQSLGPIGGAAILVANKLRKPILFYSHVIDWKLYPKSINSKILKPILNTIVKIYAKYMFNRCNLLLVPSVETMELFSFMKITAKKQVVHLGVDIINFSPPRDKRKAKEDIGINPDHLVIGSVGRFGHEKDLPTLQRAFLRLRSKKKDVTLLIVGDGREDIKKLFVNKKQILYVGQKKDPSKYYKAMDIYVLPSLEETTSLTTLEAMSCKVAPITTQVGFIKEYLKDGKNGLFFPKRDSYRLYIKIRNLITSPSQRMHLAENARSTVINKFSWEITTKKIQKAIESL